MRFLMSLALLPLLAAADPPKPKPIQIPVRQYKLDNGLRIVMSEDHSAPTYAVAVTYNVGSHALKIGYELNRIQSNGSFDSNVRGTYVFNNFQDFQAGNPLSYQQRFGNSVRGYRVLFLKKLNQGQKPVLVDWIIISVSAIFIIALFSWGIWALTLGAGMGVTGIVFGTIGSVFLFQDIRSFIRPPKEKMHWWFTHIGSMAGSYISAITAFVVVNIQLPQHNWVLWVLPTAIGSVLIARTIRMYKKQFNIV